MLLRAITMFVVIAGLAACSSIDCSLTGKVLCKYCIQTSEGEDSVLEYPLSVTFSRPLADEDTVYINQQENVSSFELPMSHIAESDAFTLTLHINDETTISDKVTITKTNQASFESVECPARYRHTLQDVTYTKNFIDTIIINDTKVSNDASAKNIFIRLNGSN